jgi:ATP-binding cassette subfamily B multidrug efflux pump
MFGGNRTQYLINQESAKPKRVSETLGRLGSYFRPFWPMLVLAAVLVIFSTWAQVTTPELTGQLVDCYLNQFLRKQPFSQHRINQQRARELLAGAG